MDNILNIENLTKIYGNNKRQVTALDNINLSIKRHSFSVIVGRSGSGKSTLLNCIGGLDVPTKGDVLINGESLYNLSDHNRTVYRRKNIGYVFQFFNLISEMTVLENIYLPSYIDKCKPDKSYVKQILERLGLSNYVSRYPAELSGGEQQRVAVARALALKPQIILADEPTGNLDKKNSDELIDLLNFSYRYFDQTILLVTHNLDIAYHADRIITMEDGHIISDYTNNQ